MRYDQCEQFIDDFEIINERYFDERHYCSIKDKSFLVKISNKRKVVYRDRHQNENIAYGSIFFSYKFIRLDNVIINSNE